MTDTPQDPCYLNPQEILSLLHDTNPAAELTPFVIHIPTGSVMGIDGRPLQIPHHRSHIGTVDDLHKWIGNKGFQKLKSLGEKVQDICGGATSDDYSPYSIISHIITASRNHNCWKIKLVPLRSDEDDTPVMIAGSLTAIDSSAANDGIATAVCHSERHVIRLTCGDDGQWTEARHFSITKREMTVLRMTIFGASCQNIAQKLGVSEPTIKNAKKSVCLKTGAKNTIDAIRILHSHAIISLE